MSSDWRLLLSGPRSGAGNMAVDEAVFRAVEQGAAPPTLRFYGWTPPCVSLGRLQRAEVVDAGDLHRRGLEVVRRPTGGRAILHDDEVTYSASAPAAACPLGTGVISTYRWISSGLIAGLANLGVAAALAKRISSHGVGIGSTSCFTAAARCDLVVDGRKLVGSAQARGRQAFLQHGSLPLALKRDLLREVLGADSDPGESATDLTTLLGATPAALVVEALTRGFESALEIKLALGDLSADEQRAARRLAAEKYDHLW